MTFSRSDRFDAIVRRIALMWLALCFGVHPVAAQHPAPSPRKAKTVSVSPYARAQNQQNVLRLPPGYKPAPAAVPTYASKTGTVPVAATKPGLPASRLPSTPALSPTDIPAPPAPVAATIKPPVVATKSSLSITDVIDTVIRNAPDLPQQASTAPPATIKTPAPASPALLSVTPPSAQNAVSRQPSKQDIAKLGETAPKFYWPLRGNVVSTFGAKGNGRKNDGVNITAPKGTAIRAAATGLVVYSGQDLGGLGNLILVRHSGGYHTAYAHVENPLVKTGDKVTAGEAIANVGKSGNVTKPQLHFEIRNGKAPVNPQAYLPQA